MSCFSTLRLVGIGSVWLALATACGGTPSVTTGNGDVTEGGTSNAGTGGRGPDIGGSFIGTPEGGQPDGGGETPTYECGNGELEPGEACDDGNTEDSDGCSGDCKTLDTDFDCSALGEPCKLVVICGDGTIEGGEVCDDGNTEDEDGCAGDCAEIEAGFACVRPGRPCVEVPVCGNGTRERGEACDDGNTAPDDGCDDACQLETGYFCPVPGNACVADVCGDGTRTPTEECDDDNGSDGDGCSHDCKVEVGFHCGPNGCQGVCGDGVVVTGEECDDGGRASGDGCSAACTKEPFFSCTGQPSTCTSTISCGNSVVEPGEVCDPPGVNGCNAGCKSFSPASETPVCGDGIIQPGEGCEPPAAGAGCTALCAVETGWTCPQPGYCFRNPFCGDSIVQASQGEACDPPNVGNGCSAACKVEPGWTCVGLGPSTCVKPVCGNGTVEPGEQCDDANGVNADGCTSCTLDVGWTCPTPGATCLPRCGDGKKLGTEQCDDGNKVSGDGCNAGCKIEAGFKCPTPNVKCEEAVCGDKTLDVGEGCDDGGLCFNGTNAGKSCKVGGTDCPGGGTCRTIAGDGCGPTCQPEPTVTVGADPKVNVFCGDGLVNGTEVCDDGNTNDGDGCEHDCKSVTTGWSCTAKTTLPKSLDMQITFRDMKSANALTAGGHPDFQYNTYSQVRGITGAASTTANCTGATPTCGQLDSEGKPVLIRTGQQTSATGTSTGTGILSQDTFALWYRDTNTKGTVGYNGAITVKPFTKTITLDQVGPVTSEVYSYSNGSFYPITAAEGWGSIGNEVAKCDAGGGANTGVRNQVNACSGCDGTCQARDYGFTSELRYFFQYKGGERLTFTGDDDVWVYVNGKLAVDLGGLHSELSGQVVLGDEDGSCSAHGVAFGSLPDPAGGCYSAAEQGSSIDRRFPNKNMIDATTSMPETGLIKGHVYEIVLFHAERHSSASNFRLTLAGFLAPRSSCNTICGDGVVTGDEACDDGPANSDTIAGRCNTACTARNYCGDGTAQTGEACDDGTNITVYKNPPTGGACAPGCKLPASCGDGALQPGPGELCDLGSANNTGAYGGCTAQCKLGGYCGDGTKNGPESCDLGSNNGKTYGDTSCGYDCKPGPHCGDGIVNDASEDCDKGDQNGVTGSGCDNTCKLVPGCGDGTLQSGLGEKCDYGQFNTPANMTPYGGCTNMCQIGPNCGDEHTDSPYEECDNGGNNDDALYDGCTSKCVLGPRCGDAVLQTSDGEQCDNGFNNDDYKFSPTSCGMDCSPPPFCGDGIKQSTYELCDQGADNSDSQYDGCTTKCDYGPFCGDGHIDVIDAKSGTEEACDNGVKNVAYAAKKGACSYDCEPAPYCGDGIRNGPEQCDLGTDKNTGDQDTCNPDCTFAPRCGDGIVQAGEQCDDGPTGSPKCTINCKKRVVQ